MKMDQPIPHFVFDTETLGIREDAVILSIGIVPVVFEENATFAELVKAGIHLKLDVESQVKRGRRIDPATVGFWKDQGEEAAHVLKPSSKDVSMEDACDIIAGFLKAKGYIEGRSWVWSRGNAFDFGKIEHMYEMVDRECPFPSYMERDIRTMVDCFCGTSRGRIEATRPQEGFVKHDALHDAASDAAKMNEIFHAMLNG